MKGFAGWWGYEKEWAFHVNRKIWALPTIPLLGTYAEKTENETLKYTCM